MRIYLIVITILCLLLSSCQNKQKKNSEQQEKLEILDDLNMDQLLYFYNHDRDSYTNIKEYKMLKHFHGLCDTLLGDFPYDKRSAIFSQIESFIEKNIRNKAIGKYCKLIDIPQKLSENHKYNIKILENLIGDYYINQYNLHFYKFDAVQVVVKPQEETVKLGEPYIAKMYVAGFNRNNESIAVVEGDTLNNEDNVPVYRAKPQEKGKYKKKGKMYIYSQTPNIDYIDIPFTFEFEVQ